MSEPVQDLLKEVMRVCPQGVTVVTTKEDNKLDGITISAFTSVSLNPPLVVISIAKISGKHDLFTRAKGFVVNFLADDQKSVSDRFAGRAQVKERFEGIRTHFEGAGFPIIDGVRAFLECRTWRVYDGGDHSLVIGEVTKARKLNDKPPLVYYTQRYTTVQHPEEPPSPFEILW